MKLNEGMRIRYVRFTVYVQAHCGVCIAIMHDMTFGGPSVEVSVISTDLL